MKHTRQTTTLLSKALITVISFMLGNMTVHAETIEEGFEEVTLVDAEGNALDNQWSWGYGLSNGWKIIGGTIDTGGNGSYTLVHGTGKGAIYTDYYLTSSSTSKNDGYVFVPRKLTGQVMLWTRSNLNSSSRKTSTLKVYEATAEGEVTETLLFSKETEKGNTTWLPCSFSIDEAEGKYIAINLVYTDIDEFSATIADGSEVTPTLTVSAGSLDFGTVQAESTQSLTVRSNVATSVSFAVEGDGAGVFQLVDAPTTLSAGVNTPLNIKMYAQEAGTYEAKLTVTAGELSKRVGLKGTWEVKQLDDDPQPDDWKGEDFNAYQENDPMPIGWVADGWYIGEPFILDTPAVVTIDGGTLITPLFEAGEGDELQFFFSKTAIGWMYYSNSMEISYSTDKVNWTVAATYDKTEDDGEKSVVLPAAGHYYVRFVANNRTYLDDFKVVSTGTTGIGYNKRETINSSRRYNLKGQHAGQLRKGLYIQNGKKYLKNKQ